MSGKPQTLAEQIRALEPLDVAGPVTPREAWEAARNQAAALADAAATTPAEHFDDHAVRQFSKMMAEKMAASRAKGRSGWDDPNQCSVEHLQALLHEHVAKGDPIDVANICMMLRHYEASTATTPVVGAEQAGDVRQAMPEWDYFQGLVNIARRSAAKAKIKFPQPNYVTLKIAEEAGEVVRGAVHYAEGRMGWDEVQGEIIQLLAMLIRFVTEGDEVNGVIPPELVRRVPPPLEPDPAPALSWRAMQTAAAEAVSKEAHGETVLGGQQFKTVKLEDAVDAILALPGPTDAQALAEAVKLPQWQAVVKCLDREKSLIWIIENTVQVLIRNLALEMLGQQRAALKAWNDGQRQPTEYEQKLAAMKKDFPNGI